MEQVGARHVDGPSRGDGPAGRVPVRRPVTRDRRGPARPVAVRARGGAMCPSPVVPPRVVPAPQGPASGIVRRVTAGIGLVVATAAAVFGLGVLSDIAGAAVASAPAGAPVSSAAQP